MSPLYVSSPQNPLLKEYRKLQGSSRQRRIKNRIALEGPNLVREALKAGIVPEVLLYTENYYEESGKAWLASLPTSVKQVILTPDLFISIAATDTPQPVAAIVPRNFGETAVPADSKTYRLILVLDRIRDPGNMGAIIRTAAAAGVDIIYYTPESADPFNPKVLRATAGTVFSVKVEEARKPLELIRNLKQNGVQLIAADARSRRSHWSVAYKLPAALLVGNESEGISRELKNEADLTVSIPLSGSVESLNAAVASAVILYEIIRPGKAD